MGTTLSHRKRLLMKLDAEYRAFLADLQRERAELAEIARLRAERKARGRGVSGQRRGRQEHAVVG